MMVGLGPNGFVQDLYYPYVGLENHTNAREQGHRIGVWVEGKFSWLSHSSWQINQQLSLESMGGITTAINAELKLKITFHDFVDCDFNVFARDIKITNDSQQTREVRLFMHQIFLIAESRRDVTCQYLPQAQTVLHYRGRRIFLVGGEHASGQAFDQYAIGLHGIEGQEGTFRDAEDGQLSGNNVEHGTVDSVIRFRQRIDAQSSSTVHYWLSAGLSVKDALNCHKQFSGEGFVKRTTATRDYWQNWLATGANSLHLVDEEFQDDVTKCLLIIKSHIDRRGGVIASGDSEMLNYSRDYYSYCWPRDAVYALWPLIRLGYYQEAKRYFEFARDVLHPDGYLAHKYQTDRSLGSSWHPYLNYGREELPIQEDETAATIFLLGEYLKASKDADFVKQVYDNLVQPAANWMDGHIDSVTKLPHASYDLWEQKFQTSTYTVGVVYGALLTAAELADQFEYPDDAIRWRSTADDIRSEARERLFNHDRQYFYKGFVVNQSDMLEFDNVIDASSLYGAVMFGLYDKTDEYVKTSRQTLEATLVNKSATQGVPRYEHDGYYRTRSDSLGNPWPVVTLWYAQYLISTGEPERARDILHWAKAHMGATGVLPEQLDPDTGAHISVSPLVWSQAEFINTVLDLKR